MVIPVMQDPRTWYQHPRNGRKRQYNVEKGRTASRMDGNSDSVVQSGPDSVVGSPNVGFFTVSTMVHHAHCKWMQVWGPPWNGGWPSCSPNALLISCQEPDEGHKQEIFGLSLRVWELCCRYPLFPQFLPIYCKTSCPRHDVKLHNYALTITTTTRGTCLWSRYPVLVIIRELEVLNFKALRCHWWP